ncbi:sphingomyelin phosphodiesterase-like protein 2 [Leptotrombidium deliense]|uniref:Sphingomyelin phosphodiesterase-like protein 2 n=1 Tax=Leptotrombidium deliense TaxID=299467 RepID=A0A443SRI6_9ACAR|nr:sphingomyelin phosphodiesterase-like protein 2 [Leptotrombidium deliense]
MVCVLFRLSTYEICHGVIESFKSTFDYIRLNSVLTSGEMCGLALGMNCALEVTKNLNWTIALPERINRINFYAKTVKRWKNVAHITDIHYDPQYTVGTTADCYEPVCCRKSPNLFSSISTSAGLFGNYLHCDTPSSTVKKSIDRMLNSHRLSYVIWTGDIPPHDIWNYKRTSTSMYISEVHQMLNEIKVPVFPAVGNHEAVPVNSFAPPEIDESLSNAWLYEKLASMWSKWLPKGAIQNVKHTGNYAVRLEPGLRIISLNTNYCARLNPWILYKSIDPGNQLKWLVEQLLNAENAGDRVHLIGHVPPDHKECTQPWLFNFVRIVQRFRDTITAQFYGHTHRDEFRVLYDSERKNDAIGFELIGPSITTYSGTNPSYRIYKINENNIVIDYETYTFNLTESHLRGEPMWYLEYKASSLLNINTISATTLHEALKSLESNSSFYSSYHRVYYTRSDVDYALRWNDRRRALLIDSHKVMKPNVAQPFSSQYQKLNCYV